jgi:hypothetical protein
MTIDFSGYTTLATLTNNVQHQLIIDNFIYVLNGINISKINLSNGIVNQTWCTIPTSNYTTLVTDGTYLYVGNSGDTNILKIELSSGNVINLNWVTIPGSRGMVIHNNYLYVADDVYMNLNKINLSDESIIETINISDQIGAGVSPLGLYIYKNFLYILCVGNGIKTIYKYTLSMTFVNIVSSVEDVDGINISLSIPIIGNYIYYLYVGSGYVMNLLDGAYTSFTVPLLSEPNSALTTDGINLWAATGNQVIYYNGSGELPISNICFVKGTPIVTDQGIIEIQDITNENTINNIRVKYITQTTTNDDSLVCIEKDAICENIPSQRTILSENHKLLYNGQMVKAKNVTTSRIPYNGEILYNVLLEENGLMLVNNLICETLDVNNVVALLYEHPQKNGITNRLNSIKDNDVYKKTAIELLC